MARKLLKQNEKGRLFHHTGISTFKGCSCYKDCTCNEDFKPTPYNYYTVNRIMGKTTYHDTIEEALIRWDFINTLKVRTKP